MEFSSSSFIFSPLTTRAHSDAVNEKLFFFWSAKKTRVKLLWNCFWNEEGTLDSAYKNIIFFLIIPYLLLLPSFFAWYCEDLTFRDAIGRNKNKFHEHGISSLLLCFFLRKLPAWNIFFFGEENFVQNSKN